MLSQSLLFPDHFLKNHHLVILFNYFANVPVFFCWRKNLFGYERQNMSLVTQIIKKPED